MISTGKELMILINNACDLPDHCPFNRDLNLPLAQVLNQENEYQRKRESASYILRMKEINRLTQKTIMTLSLQPRRWSETR